MSRVSILILICLISVLFITLPFTKLALATSSNSPVNYKQVIEDSERVFIGFSTKKLTQITEQDIVKTCWEVTPQFILKGERDYKPIVLHTIGGQTKDKVLPGVSIEPLGAPYIFFLSRENDGDWRLTEDIIGVRPLSGIKVDFVSKDIILQVIDGPLLNPLKDHIRKNELSFKVKLVSIK